MHPRPSRRRIRAWLLVALATPLSASAARAQIGDGKTGRCAPPHAERVTGRLPLVSRAFCDAAADADARAHRARGLALSERGQHKEAVGAFRRALRLAPGDHVAQLGLAQAYERAGKPLEALRAYERLAELAPDSPREQQLLGWALLEYGRAEQALAAFRLAARLSPEHAAPHYGAGVALIALGRHEEALRTLREAVRRAPSDAGAWGQMGVAAASVQRTTEAVSYWERALKEDPGYFDARPAERRRWEQALAMVGPQWPADVAEARAPAPAPSEAAAFKPAASKPAAPKPALAARTSSGSGFLVTRDGYALTNKHVVRACSAVRFRTETSALAEASVVALDPDDDLALLKANIAAPATVSFRGDPPVRSGDDVVAVGFPLTGLLADQVIVTTGNVSALAGLYNDNHVLQMSAPVQRGSSGGPLFDSSGNVVGIVVTKLNAMLVAEETGDFPQNVNFAIKGEVARAFLDAQKVAYDTQSSSWPRSHADVAEAGRRATVLVECHR